MISAQPGSFWLPLMRKANQELALRCTKTLATIALAVLAVGTAAPSAVAAAPQAAAAAHQARAAASGACRTATGPFTVSGTQVLGRGGRPFVSYGITVPGLQGLDWASFGPLDQQKIAAVAHDWCANTVRLQLNQNNLLGLSGSGYNLAYLTAIQSAVSAAEHDHMVVVLNDNTEFSYSGEQALQRGPTPATKTFWKDLASRYGHDPQVIFDLFNEPRTADPGMPLAQQWQLWLNGGSFGGVTYPFGMAALASYVRNTLGAQNLFWIEGPDMSTSFAGMVSNGAQLPVSNVVYAVHHPAAPDDQASWDADFGYLVTMGIAPVVDGEWTNYEPVPTAGPTTVPTSCWPDAATAVPEYLQYLAAHGIGLNAYQLQPGYLVKSYGDMAGPTTINAQTWSCAANSEPQPGQGTGSLLMAWYRQQNS
jgi:Cellulase (glycosyl hydrolase family 5)